MTYALRRDKSCETARAGVALNERVQETNNPPALTAIAVSYESRKPTKKTYLEDGRDEESPSLSEVIHKLRLCITSRISDF